MKIYIALALAATVMVAGCKEEKDEAATAATTEQATANACSSEDLMQMSQDLAAKIQQNPERAQELMARMQELAPQLQAATSSGEVNADLVNDLCVAYTDMLADF